MSPYVEEWLTECETAAVTTPGQWCLGEGGSVGALCVCVCLPCSSSHSVCVLMYQDPAGGGAGGPATGLTYIT